MKTYKIHLVRCGLTEANLQGRYLGRDDVPVCDKGIEQLKYFKETFTYPPVQAVFTSPLQRCKQTAAMLFPGAPMVEIPNFTEYDFGEFEGFTAEELKGNEAFERWLGDSGDAAPPFGESNNHFKARVAIDFEKVVDGLIKTGTTESAIVTHGGVLMWILSFFGLPEAPMHDWLCESGCGYTLLVTPSLWMRTKKVEVHDTFPESIRDRQSAAEQEEQE
ncbi:MAG: histidine phosphatase family protein [Clostridia bacterium]|nr:histidine phosphatase family protein [Clostridia bacterium]